EDWPSVDCTLVIAGLTGRSRDAVGSLLDRMLAASRTLVIVEPFTDDAEADDHQAEELITTLATTGNPTLTSGELTATLRGLGAAEAEVRDIGWGFGRLRSAVIATSSCPLEHPSRPQPARFEQGRSMSLTRLSTAVIAGTAGLALLAGCQGGTGEAASSSSSETRTVTDATAADEAVAEHPEAGAHQHSLPH